ncbi:uncharacterized protein LOC126901462 [Daktulosphaira vitifoliae]|uniref:uncharacterized protein LOC126901462 n=1 Tax=Daktulosphaira vitifoliae TaxID=58002 RepID=UPI0021AADE33|nr:uncharacterized protein LOC126901462 [Daktulosphaira vitifoliae]
MAHRTKLCDQGGIFNASRPLNYSVGTRSFLNDLINESRLTTLQRKSVEGWLRSGKQPSIYLSPTSLRTSAPANIKRDRCFKPRTLKNIVESGAYEPESFQSDRRTKNYSAEKERLQSIMMYGKVTKIDSATEPKKSIVAKQININSEDYLIDSVILEIEDREKFLSNMEILGQAAKYRESITFEIRDRVRHLQEFLRKTSSTHRQTDIQKIALKYRQPQIPSKPYKIDIVDSVKGMQ